MKLKIEWNKLGKALWAAVKPVLLGAIGGGLVSFTSGCSSMTPSSRGQSTEIIALGIPAVAWISHTTQEQTNDGGETNAARQTTSVTGSVPVQVTVPVTP